MHTSNLVVNQIPPKVPPGPPSQYARMIPGVSALPTPRTAAAAAAPPIESMPACQWPGTANPADILPQILLPRPTTDLRVFSQIVGDLFVLGIVGLAQAFLLPRWSFHLHSLALFAALVTLFAFSEGVYRTTPDPFPADTFPGLTRSVLLASFLVFFADGDGVRLRAIPATLAIGLCSLLAFRQLKQITWARQRHDSELRRVLLVGAGSIGRAIAAALQNDPSYCATVCGFVDDRAALSPEVLGRVEDLPWLARGEFIDEIILACPGDAEIARRAADIAFSNHLDIRAVPTLPPGPWPDAGVDRIGDVPVVTLHREHVPTAALLLKRALDLVVASLALLLAAPAMALIALLIRLDSPGSVLYSAERIGAKGRRFRCYKFRSMTTNADHLKEELRSRNQRQGPIFKIASDPRITRIGRFLRRYSLDELPQLWNVLRGEMSLVGPRPHPIDDVNRYELHHYRRLDVKPGITGLWQITARDCPSFDLNMHLDLTYIENWSLRLDLRILLGTFRVLFAPEGV